MADYYPYKVHADSLNSLVILDPDNEVLCHFINHGGLTTSEDLEKADLVCVLLNRHYEAGRTAPWETREEDDPDDDSDDTDSWDAT